jgi:lipopolysaccharide transport system ATP-binding protein
MKPVIEIKQLGKKYRIGKSESYLALRDVLHHRVKSLFSSNQQKSSTFWALDDISFEVKQGERVGIIGRNGAGKSTLLKILSRVTWPTTGSATIRGRLASLLEVGTGFHPELTGRENIFFNGSILGLKKAEISRQFDAIVDFSGVQQFLDSPLKYYSSGMQLRLAFAVAAHLEPEVLLIDEVLAVGDLEFQKKCIGKIEEVSRDHGRTILFVSHNMSYIASLCDTAILLDKGKMVTMDKSTKVVSAYLNQDTRRAAEITWKENERPGNNIVRLQSLRLVDTNGKTSDTFPITETVGIEMTYEVLQDNHVLWLGHNIHNEYGVNVFDTHSTNTAYYQEAHKKGIHIAVVWIPGNLLNAGSYFISSAIFNHLENMIHLQQHQLLRFTVQEVFEVQTARGMTGGDFPGVIRPLLNWTIKTP